LFTEVDGDGNSSGNDDANDDDDNMICACNGLAVLQRIRN